ncbi:MAG: hypothetical protein HC817_05925 [Saprospiraceae bacterium]|nr:hypothetical protein [Saprospiraceae bacterium]
MKIKYLTIFFDLISDLIRVSTKNTPPQYFDLKIKDKTLFFAYIMVEPPPQYF